MACIDSQSSLYNLIKQTFITLPFYNQQSKEKIFSRLLLKHTNLSFRIHLITQYRSLINYKSEMVVWIKSKYILFKEIKALNVINIDYLGHIISFAFYWKALLNKFIKDYSTKISLHFDVDLVMNEYMNTFLNIKKQL